MMTKKNFWPHKNHLKTSLGSFMTMIKLKMVTKQSVAQIVPCYRMCHHPLQSNNQVVMMKLAMAGLSLIVAARSDLVPCVDRLQVDFERRSTLLDLISWPTRCCLRSSPLSTT